MNDSVKEKSFSRWYSKHSDTLNSSRKERYHNDPEYRQKCIDNARAARERRKTKQAALGEQKATTKILNGVEVVVYRITEAAKIAGISPQTLRKLEMDGIIPESSFPGVHRYYTEKQVGMIRVCLDEVKKHPLHTKERSEALDQMTIKLREGW